MPAARPTRLASRLRAAASTNDVVETFGVAAENDNGRRALSCGAKRPAPCQARPLGGAADQAVAAAQAAAAKAAQSTAQGADVASVGRSEGHQAAQLAGAAGESAVVAEPDLCELLAAQLGAAQQALATQHELALHLATKRWEAARQAELQVVALEKENALLQDLFSMRSLAGSEPVSRARVEASPSLLESGSMPGSLGTASEEMEPVEGEEVLPPRPPDVQGVPPPTWSAPGMVVNSQDLMPCRRSSGGSRGMPEAVDGPHILTKSTAESEACTWSMPGMPLVADLREVRARQFFKIHESWQREEDDGDLAEQNARAIFRVKRRQRARTQALVSLKEAQEDSEDSQAISCKDGVLGPNAILRVVWDFFSLMFVLYDVSVIPLQLLEMRRTDLLPTLGMVTRLFWTADMPLSFNTGFVRPTGSIEMNRPAIARKYLRSWFLVDVLVLTIDWLDMAQDESGGNFAGLGKASRGFRLIRMVRLIRVVRINKRLESLLEYINSERLLIVVDIVKNMFIILGTSHFVACVWASIDTSDQSWRVLSGYGGRDISSLYLMAFHWALAQFSGGMDEVTPGTELERGFAVGVLLVAFIAASIFVSSITSSMTQLTIINSQESQQLSILKKYLSQTKITKGLSSRIMNNAQHMLIQRQRHLDEHKVEILGMISDPLRVELHFEIYTQPLSSHPFFRAYTEDSPNVVRRVCHKAMRMCIVSRGDSLFVAGEIPANPSMYIVCRGELTYTSLRGITDVVCPNDWVSEGSLWLSNWRHMGELVADIECCLCILDAEQFRAIASCFQHLTKLDPRSYATSFVEAINECEPEDITDLPLDSERLYEHYSSYRLYSIQTIRATVRRSIMNLMA